MRLVVRNGYRTRIWIVGMKWDPAGCGQYGNWSTRGWWGPQPGQEVQLFSTTNRYAAYYAEADDGAFWAGSVGPVYVYRDAFDSCIGIGSTASDRRVGLRSLDLGPNAGSDGKFTLTLHQ